MRLPCCFFVVLVLVITTSSLEAEINYTGSIFPYRPPGEFNWDLRTNLYVGHTSDGLVSIDGGSTINCFSCLVGLIQDTTGTLEISGQESELNICTYHEGTFYVGISGNGNISVNRGASLKNQGFAVIGKNVYSTSSVSLSEGASWNVILTEGAGTILVVGDSGQASLSIESGSSLEVDSDCTLGSSDRGNGHLFISDSEFMSQSLTVGKFGKGSLVARDGALIELNYNLYVAQQSYSQGSVRLSGEKTSLCCRIALIGAGGYGTFEISNGASFYDYGSSGNGLRIGSSYPDPCQVLVTDKDSRMAVEVIVIEAANKSQLKIFNQGLVQAKQLKGNGAVYMKTGGQLALSGDFQGGLPGFMEQVEGNVSILFWDEQVEDWIDLSEGLRNKDYKLQYNSEGSLEGFTVLTVGGFDPLILGDADTDGDVDMDDFCILKSNYGVTLGALWEDGDFDGDGDVDIFDFLILKGNYGQISQ